jgi:hypothetical protein
MQWIAAEWEKEQALKQESVVVVELLLMAPVVVVVGHSLSAEWSPQDGKQSQPSALWAPLRS